MCVRVDVSTDAPSLLRRDPKNSGSVPRDIITVLARACEAYTQKEANEVMQKVPEVVSRKAFVTACILVGLQKVTDQQFDAIVDPLLEKKIE